MKHLLSIFLIVLVVSCEKEEAFIPTPEYLLIVGDWESIEGSDYTTISIHKDGEIQVVRNDQRSKLIRTNYIEFKVDHSSFYNTQWDYYRCTDIHHNNLNESFFFFSTKNSDTLLSYIGGVEYFDSSTIKIRFIRQ